MNVYGSLNKIIFLLLQISVQYCSFNGVTVWTLNGSLISNFSLTSRGKAALSRIFSGPADGKR